MWPRRLRAALERIWPSTPAPAVPIETDARTELAARQASQAQDIERLTNTTIERLRAEARVLGRHHAR